MTQAEKTDGKKKGWLWAGCGGCGCLVLVLVCGGGAAALGGGAFFPDQADEDSQYAQGRIDAAEYDGRPIDDCFEAAAARATACDPLDLVSCIRRPEAMFSQCVVSGPPDPTFCQRYQQTERCAQECERQGGAYTCLFFCGRADSFVSQVCDDQ